MRWWHELRDARNRLVEIKRGFTTQAEAEIAGNNAMRIVLDISPGRTLRVVTGGDSPGPN